MRLLDRVMRAGLNPTPYPPTYQTSNLDFFQTLADMGSREKIGDDFLSYARDGFAANAVVYALENARARYFSQMSFKFRNLTDKHLHGNPALELLEKPWAGGDTSDLLKRMLVTADLAGTAFICYRPGGVTETGEARPGRLEVLRPDWVTIAMCEVEDPVTGVEWMDIAGFVYRPGGNLCTDPEDIQYLPVADGTGIDNGVALWAPTPDPLSYFRGMSWIAPLVREINNDQSMGALQDSFFRNGATPNTVIKYQRTLTPAGAERVREMWNARHGGTSNAFKTAVFDDGADFQVVGSNFAEMAFQALRSQGETRMAAAAGVPPIVAGLSEGLANATYSNYQQSLRAFSDGTLRDLWQSACVALAPLIQVPADSRLWFDTTDIDALRDSEMDRANAQQTTAVALGELIRVGFEPDSAVAALESGDMSQLKHTGGIPTALYPAGQIPDKGGPESNPKYAPAGSSVPAPKDKVPPTGDNKTTPDQNMPKK